MSNKELTSQFLIPTVIEKLIMVNELMIFILVYSKDRIIFLGTEINDHIANVIIAQLLF